MQNQDNTNLIYGGFFVRLAAYFIDILLMGTLLLVIKVPFWIATIVNSNNLLQKPFLFHFSATDIFFYLLGVLYFVLMTYLSGATIGKKLLRLRVIATDQTKLTLFNVIYRETIGRYLSTVILWIGYFLVGVDKEKKGLHDILCDTRVVYDFSLETHLSPEQSRQYELGQVESEQYESDQFVPEQVESDQFETEKVDVERIAGEQIEINQVESEQVEFNQPGLEEESGEEVPLDEVPSEQSATLETQPEATESDINTETSSGVKKYQAATYYQKKQL